MNGIARWPVGFYFSNLSINRSDFETCSVIPRRTMGGPNSVQCPYCGAWTVLNEGKSFKHDYHWLLDTKEGVNLALHMVQTVCMNALCHKTKLRVWLSEHENDSIKSKERYEVGNWRLMPKSYAKVLPSYVPTPIVEDYEEACAIRDESPKASATLARRCLQGMIRDFHKIAKARLVDEIDALEGIVDVTTWESIDAVRQVGNIGAHMEKDINLIVEVDPEEAQLLISLIEQLIEDWYVARHEREQRAAAIAILAAEKKVAKTGALAAPAQLKSLPSPNQGSDPV